MKKLLLISSIFPSTDQPDHAAFMLNVIRAYEENDFIVEKIVVKGRNYPLFVKIYLYFSFYFKILFQDLSRYDYIHVSYPSHAYLPFLIKRIDKKIKLIVRFHGEDLLPENRNKFESFIIRGVSKRSIKRSNLVIVPSNYYKNEVLNLCACDNIYIYPSGGVRKDVFYPMEIPHDNFVIGYVGRLDRSKGLWILADALKKVSFSYHLIIIGSGVDQSDYFTYLNQSDIDYEYIGRVKQNQLNNYYNSFNALVFPTMRKAESFGNVGIEAMACGIPVIGSDIGGLGEYLIDRVNGFVFKSGSVSELCIKLEMFYHLNKIELSEMKKNALITAENFDFHKLSVDFSQILKAL